jgi:hypothetical protein
MQKRKRRLRCLFIDAGMRVSIAHLQDAPARLPGFVRTFKRIGVDIDHNLFTYEEDREYLISRAIARRMKSTEVDPGQSGIAEQLVAAIAASRELNVCQ